MAGNPGEGALFDRGMASFATRDIERVLDRPGFRVDRVLPTPGVLSMIGATPAGS